MTQTLLILLLFLAIALPVVGAVLFRLVYHRVTERQMVLGMLIVFLVSVVSVLILARSGVDTLRVAGLTVLSPDVGQVDPLEALPGQGEIDIGPTLALPSPTSAATAVLPTKPVPTLAPSVTPRPSVTAVPSLTAIPSPTAEPTATPEPPTATAEPATATPAPASEPRRYTVQPGDTLGSIARQFDVSVAELLEANDLTPQEADNLRPGQELIIP